LGFRATPVGGRMKKWTIATSFGVFVGLASTAALAPDFGVLLGGTTALKQQVDADAARLARPAQTFGAGLGATERRDLQRTCTALVVNENDAAARRQLQAFLARYSGANHEAALRFCLEPSYRQLQRDLETSLAALRRAKDAKSQTGLTTQDALQRQQRTYQTISNVMKTKHDTVKNSISNVR
jgi:hypothetical protein